MPYGRKCRSEIDAAARIRLLVIGSVFAVFMRATTVLAMIVPGNNAALSRTVVAVGNLFAVVGKGVGSPDQWPEDGQNPGCARQGGFAQFRLQQ